MRPGGFPRRRDQWSRLDIPSRKNSRKGGCVVSDITLAVGDGTRRMTYAELASVRGISALSAERLVRRRNWPRQVGNDGVVRVLVPLTEARTQPAKARKNGPVSAPGRPRRTSIPDTPDVRGIIREVIREIADAAPPDIRDDDRDDSEAIRALQGVLEERNRTIAAHEATIRDLRARLDSEVEERRRLQERLTALLTHRQTGSVPSVQQPAPGPRLPWWRRLFR